MLASDQKPVEILNELIIINYERINGFDYASKESDAPILKDLFSRLTETSLQFKKELANEVYKLGGIPAEGVPTPELVQKAWEDVKTSLIYHDHLTLLKSCDNEETVIIQLYENALHADDENLTTQHQKLFSRQYDLLNADHTKVKNLLSILLKAN